MRTVFRSIKTKKYIVRSFVVFLLTLPPILVYLWHMENRRLPESDAIGYFSGAVKAYAAFQERGVWVGLKTMYLDRGWRPIVYPVVAIPFLLATKGNLLLTVAYTSVFLLSLLTYFTYRLFRRYLPFVPSVFGTLIVTTNAFVFDNSTNFMSDLSFVVTVVAGLYYLLRSNFFASAYDSLWSGIFLGLSFCIRPAESFTLGIVIVIFTVQAVRQGNVDINAVLGAVAVLLSAVCALIYGNYVFTPEPWVFVSCFALVAGLAMPLFWSGYWKSGLFTATVAIAALNVVWWMPAIRQLLLWSYDGSFGSVALSHHLQRPSITGIIKAMTDYLRDTALVFGPLALGGLIIGLAMTGNWRHLRFLFNAPLLISLLMWSLMILAYTQVAWDGGATKRALPAMVVGAIGLLLAAFQAFQSSFWRYIVTVIAAVFGFIQMCAIGVQASPVVIGSHFADVMDTLTLHKLDVRKMGVPSPSRYAEEPHLVLVDRLLGLRGKYNLDSATMFVAHTGSRAELINAFTLMFASQVKKTSFSVGIDPFISDPIAIASNWDYVIADDLSPLTVEDLESFRSTYAVAAARIVLDYRLKRPSPLVLLETIDVEGRNILFFRSDGRRGPQLTKK